MHKEIFVYLPPSWCAPIKWTLQTLRVKINFKIVSHGGQFSRFGVRSKFFFPLKSPIRSEMWSIREQLTWVTLFWCCQFVLTWHKLEKNIFGERNTNEKILWNDNRNSKQANTYKLTDIFFFHSFWPFQFSTRNEFHRSNTSFVFPEICTFRHSVYYVHCTTYVAECRIPVQYFFGVI